MRKSREAFVQTINDLSQGDISGKQRVIRYIERVIDRRAGAAEAVKGAGKGSDQMEG